MDEPVPLALVRRAWRHLMDATAYEGARYPYVPVGHDLRPERGVALAIATYAPTKGPEPRAATLPVIWWSTRPDREPRLGRADWCLRLPSTALPLPALEDWPPEARGWLVEQIAPGRTHAEVARVIPYGLWPTRDRDRLAWHLRHEEGWTADDVGTLLGITGRAARMAAARHVGRS